MSFFNENKPRTLSDLVFADQATESAFFRHASVHTAGNVLLYGPGGSGKSAALRVLAETLLTPGYDGYIIQINVSRVTTKAALCDQISSIGSLVAINPLGKWVFVLEELDGADKAAQKALKGILDDVGSNALFFATTNALNDIDAPIRTRFDKINFPHPSPKRWANRAVQILHDEGIRVTEDLAANVIRKHCEQSGEGDMREILRGLEEFAMRVRQANNHQAGGAV